MGIREEKQSVVFVVLVGCFEILGNLDKRVVMYGAIQRNIPWRVYRGATTLLRLKCLSYHLPLATKGQRDRDRS